jgi:hypothetical protein
MRRVGDELWVEEDQPYRFHPSDFERVTDDLGQWHYYSLSGARPRVEAGEPVQPSYRKRLGAVTLDDRQFFEARGVVLTSATYRDESGFEPLVERAGVLGIDSTGQDTPPAFDEPGWYPRVPLSVRLLYDHSDGGARNGGNQADLLINVGQYHAGTSTERLFEELVVDEYYTSSTDRDAPEVTHFAVVDHGDEQRIELRTEDEAGILRVVVAYVESGRPWRSVELESAEVDAVWRGPIPRSESYVVQIVDGAGNVTTIDDRGSVVRPCDGMCGGSSPAGELWRAFLPSTGAAWRP